VSGPLSREQNQLAAPADR